MSMQVTNESNIRALVNECNKNNFNAEKTFEKLSSGLKIVSVADDSSAWAISEKMRNTIRAFSQDSDNVQNDSALVKTAERGIDLIVQNLRSIRELAINSANDSNTDADRAVMQKQLENHLQTIQDIAIDTEYNGKKLLTGRYTDVAFKILSEWDQDTDAKSIIKNFVAYGDMTVSHDVASHNGGIDSATGKPKWFSFQADIAFKSKTNYEHTAYLDFSGYQRRYAYAAGLHNQGFTILCSGCIQYINIRFDATKSANQSSVNRTSNTLTINGETKTNDVAGEFIIGIKGVEDSDELADAVFEGVKSINGNYGNTGEILLDRTRHTITLGKSSDGSLYIKQSGGPSMLFKAGLIRNDAVGDLPGLDLPEPDPLWAQHGAEAGQRFHIFINDMRLGSLGLANGKISVNTLRNAQRSIGRIETAIEYALNEAANMGAYFQRLEATHLNVTTKDENIQSAELKIRDADMAREMTNYTRCKVLAFSSQSMLAQANSEGKQVLGLLQ